MAFIYKKPQPVTTNPLKSDPSRTAGIRRAWCAQIEAKFKELNRRVWQYIAVENVFGIGMEKVPHPVFNNNPNHDALGRFAPAAIHIERVKKAFNKHESDSGLPGYARIADVRRSSDLPSYVFDNVIGHLRKQGHISLSLLEGRHKPSEQDLKDAYHEGGEVFGVMQSKKNWHLTSNLETEIGERLKERLESYHEKRLAEWGYVKTPFDLETVKKASERLLDWPYEESVENTRFRFASTPDQLKLFQEWLTRQMSELFFPHEEESWWLEYIKRGWQQGAARVYNAWKLPTEFLRTSFNMPVLPEKVRVLASRVLTELKNVTTDMATKMGRELVGGLAQGKSPREVAKAINESIEGVSKQRALMIARTETVRAHAEGQLDTLKNLGVEEVGVAVEWVSSGLKTTKITTTGKGKNKKQHGGNPSPCELCAPMVGMVFSLEEASGMIPRHPNCIIGDTIITACSPLVMMRGEYTGEIVELVTTFGRKLSVTPNHIVLSQRGWVFAKHLTNEDYLIDCIDCEMPLIAPDDYGREPCISEVYESLIKLTDERVVTESLSMPEYFHGDGKSINSKIQIVPIDSELWDQSKSPLSRKIKESLFNIRDIGTINSRKFQCFSRLSTFLRSACFASDGIMCCLNEISLLLGRSLTSHQAGSFRSCSERYTTGNQDFPNSTSICPAPPSYLNGPEEIYRIQLDNLIVGKMAKIKSHSTRHVINLSVYDVSTQETSYLANGFITSNCLCSFVPANVGEDPSRQTRSYRGISTAMRKSIKAEIPAASKRTIAQQFKRTNWTGAKNKIDRDRPESVLNFNPNHDKLGRFASAPTSLLSGVRSISKSQISSSLRTSDGLANYVALKLREAGHRVTELQLDKLRHLNPNGIKYGSITLPDGLYDHAGRFEHLKKILPKGLVLKRVIITKQQINKTSDVREQTKRDILSRMSQSGVNYHQRHGMAVNERLKTIEFAGMQVHYPPGRESHVADSLVRLDLHNAPNGIVDSVQSITFTSQKNEKDRYWEKEYNMPGFRSGATGGRGEIVVYNNRPLPRETYNHEAGHNLANRLWGDNKPPKDSSYGIAQTKERPVTGYGAKSPSEDFADAVSLYVTQKGNLRHEFPLKFKALEDILEKQHG